jgi:hypothetical protein
MYSLYVHCTIYAVKHLYNLYNFFSHKTHNTCTYLNQRVDSTKRMRIFCSNLEFCIISLLVMLKY